MSLQIFDEQDTYMMKLKMYFNLKASDWNTSTRLWQNVSPGFNKKVIKVIAQSTFEEKKTNRKFKQVVR